LRFLFRATLILLAALILLLSVAVGLFRATVQRVTPYPEELRTATGELGSMEGEPVDAIVWDRSAALEEKDGILYMDSSRSYPLQVRSLAWISAPVLGSLLLLAGILGYSLKRAAVPPRS
jgi:hypothetical protein